MFPEVGTRATLRNLDRYERVPRNGDPQWISLHVGTLSVPCPGGSMSVTKYDGRKVVLPRSGADEFWKLVQDHYAGQDTRAWKYLAMLALRENAGWPLELIGSVFGHPKGHVTRCLSKIKQELRDRFQASPDFLELPDEPDEHPGENAAQLAAKTDPHRG